MNKNEKLDEMQVQKRNKIGNKCFMAMFYILYIDIGLNMLGIKWLAYPVNVLVIITVCMGYYLFMTIWSGSYLGVRSGNENSRYLIGGIIASGFLLISGIIIAIVFRGKDNIFSNIGIVIIVITIAMLIILAIMALGNISRRKNDSGED